MANSKLLLILLWFKPIMRVTNAYLLSASVSLFDMMLYILLKKLLHF